MGEALSTFRVAAKFCEEFDGFVFNHNEAILYEWVRDAEPELFAKILDLIKRGRWHVMGGWYLQPDCNMPSGEAFLRQIQRGREFFKNEMNCMPETAINFDPFGHSRGLVQIMAKSGYKGYVFCRPGQDTRELEADEFVWKGYDGSEVIAVRVGLHYNSAHGQAVNKLKEQIKRYGDREHSLMLWGIGNHGGGPSRRDLNELADYLKADSELRVKHSTPDEYVRLLEKKKPELPRLEDDINPWGVGCYTSMSRIKQKYRELENMLFSTEKICSMASLAGGIKWPEVELREAERDMLFAQFHDILPGSGSPAVEKDSLRLMEHGLEILSRQRARAVLAMAKNSGPVREGEVPVFVTNPHPWKVKCNLDFEAVLPIQHEKRQWRDIEVRLGRKKLPSQVEQEQTYLPSDWVKRVVTEVTLPPMSVVRLDLRDCKPADKPKLKNYHKGNCLVIPCNGHEVAFNLKTGLLDSFKIKGREYLKKNACCPVLVEDDIDPWGSLINAYRGKEHPFRLMTQREAVEYSGAKDAKPIAVIEDGEVRTVVETLFRLDSSVVVMRISIAKNLPQIDVAGSVFWNHRESLLKLSIPTSLEDGEYLGQSAFGVEPLHRDGRECVSLQYGMLSEKKGRALAIIDDGIYGSDCKKGRVRLSVLRSPAYSSLPMTEGGLEIMPQDRYTPRIDMGRREFNFRLTAGDAAGLRRGLDRLAMEYNESPWSLPWCPPGTGKGMPKPLMEIKGGGIVCSAYTKSRNGKDSIVRLFNPSDKKQNCKLRLASNTKEHKLHFIPCEVKTFQINQTGSIVKEMPDMTDV